MTKKERRIARHERRVSRRALLKGAGAAVAAMTASLFVPRMVHSAVVKPVAHPTWDKLLDHISISRPGRRQELNQWVHGLVKRPHKPQPALLLIGPECAGKSTFHRAMGLLLPERAVLQYPDHLAYSRIKYSMTRGDLRAVQEEMVENDERNDEALKLAWLLVVEGEPDRFVTLFSRNRCRAGRYLKWCLTNTREVDEEVPNILRFHTGQVALPQADLLRRLEDERDAYCQTLSRYQYAA